MKKLIIALALVLGACKTAPDTGLAPAIVPPELTPYYAQKAPRLPDITDDTMGGRELAGAESDKMYNDVAHRYNDLVTIYTCVRQALIDKKAVEGCLKDNTK